MTHDDIIKAFESLRIWQRGDRRAVHKPLLVLFALARVASGAERTIDWNDADPILRALLDEFGPDGSGATRHNPFWHLRTDGLWTLDGPDFILCRPPGATPTISELRENHVRGGFPLAIFESLRKDNWLISAIARRIVQAHFPESIRDDVLAAVGLSVMDEGSPSGQSPDPVRRRDPAFRENVLMAYQYRCGVCGHDLRMGRQTIGLEAAHIKWFQARGPDVVSNGIAMCSLHHKVFDLGVFKILPDSYQMVFSQHLNGSEASARTMLAYHGAGLILPQSREYLPAPMFLDWHSTQVFKSPARTG